jgi:hypothetical protein
LSSSLAKGKYPGLCYYAVFYSQGKNKIKIDLNVTNENGIISTYNLVIDGEPEK